MTECFEAFCDAVCTSTSTSTRRHCEANRHEATRSGGSGGCCYLLAVDGRRPGRQQRAAVEYVLLVPAQLVDLLLEVDDEVLALGREVGREADAKVFGRHARVAHEVDAYQREELDEFHHDLAVILGQRGEEGLQLLRRGGGQQRREARVGDDGLRQLAKEPLQHVGDDVNFIVGHFGVTCTQRSSTTVTTVTAATDSVPATMLR